MNACPYVTLLERPDHDYDVVRCERPEGHDDSHFTTDPRTPAFASNLEWAYDPPYPVENGSGT